MPIYPRPISSLRAAKPARVNVRSARQVQAPSPSRSEICCADWATYPSWYSCEYPQ